MNMLARLFYMAFTKPIKNAFIPDTINFQAKDERRGKTERNDEL